MMDLLIISNYWHFEWEKSSSRYLSIANLSVDSGLEVEVVTSSFYHTTKQQRNASQEELNSCKYKATLISEPGYKKNVDPKRILSHKKFAYNVERYLTKRKKPDVIYLFVPPLDLAEKVVKYANHNNIKLIIDILDLWPEAYKMILPFPKVTRYLLEPMRRKANKIYAGADDIVAVSETYVNRALSCNKKCDKGLAVYIGTEFEVFDKYAKKKNAVKRDDEFWIAYIGTLGRSYNLYCVIDAMKKMKYSSKAKLLVMGDGPERNEFESYAQLSGINYEFTGKLSYDEMVPLLCQCDIAVNPIKGSSAASIINKVSDYAAAGLPVINTQESKEYKDLLSEYRAGFSFAETDIDGIAVCLDKLISDDGLRKEIGKNSRTLFEEKFSRNDAYSSIIKKITGGYNACLYRKARAQL